MTSFLLGVHASITLLAAFLNLTGWNLLSVGHHSLNLVPEEFQGTRDSAWRRLALQQQTQRQPTRALVHIDKPLAATHPESVMLKVKWPLHPACADVPASVDYGQLFCSANYEQQPSDLCNENRMARDAIRLPPCTASVTCIVAQPAEY